MCKWCKVKSWAKGVFIIMFSIQCVAMCRSILQRVAVCRSVSQFVAVCRSVSQCAAVCRSVPQCVAVCRNVSQCNAVCCSVLREQCVLCVVPPLIRRDQKYVTEVGFFEVDCFLRSRCVLNICSIHKFLRCVAQLWERYTVEMAYCSTLPFFNIPQHVINLWLPRMCYNLSPTWGQCEQYKQRTAAHCYIHSHTEQNYSALQHTAAYHSTLQHPATRCKTL